MREFTMVETYEEKKKRQEEERKKHNEKVKREYRLVKKK